MAFDDYFDEKLYRMQNTPEVQEIQLHKLRQHLTKFYHQSPLVKTFVDSQGVPPEKMTLEVFRQAFPLMGQDTMRGSMAAEGVKEPGYIVQMISGMLGIDPDDYVLMCATSGTTGEPTPYFFTAEDLEIMPRGTSRGLFMVTHGNKEEIRKMRTIQGFGLSMFGAGVPLVESLTRLGVACIPVGAEAGTERILKFSERFAANCIWCTPSLAEYMVDTALDRIRAARGSRGPGRADDRAPRAGIFSTPGGGDGQAATVALHPAARLPLCQFLHRRNGRLDPPGVHQTHPQHRLRCVLQALASDHRR
jgi:phenylacetate-coenzyme A ligase PaaK-like adenylate-forming protein